MVTCTFAVGAVDPGVYTDLPLIVFLSRTYRTTFVPFRYDGSSLGHRHDLEAKTFMVFRFHPRVPALADCLLIVGELGDQTLCAFASKMIGNGKYPLHLTEVLYESPKEARSMHAGRPEQWTSCRHVGRRPEPVGAIFARDDGRSNNVTFLLPPQE